MTFFVIIVCGAGKLLIKEILNQEKIKKAIGVKIKVYPLKLIGIPHEFLWYTLIADNFIKNINEKIYFFRFR